MKDLIVYYPANCTTKAQKQAWIKQLANKLLPGSKTMKSRLGAVYHAL